MYPTLWMSGQPQPNCGVDCEFVLLGDAGVRDPFYLESSYEVSPFYRISPFLGCERQPDDSPATWLPWIVWVGFFLVCSFCRQPRHTHAMSNLDCTTQVVQPPYILSIAVPCVLPPPLSRDCGRC